MGMVRFLLPARVNEDLRRELEHACMAGGPDNMPWPTEVRVDAKHLTLRRSVDESGALVVPWDIFGSGRLPADVAVAGRAYPRGGHGFRSRRDRTDHGSGRPAGSGCSRRRLHGWGRTGQSLHGAGLSDPPATPAGPSHRARLPALHVRAIRRLVRRAYQVIQQRRAATGLEG